MTHTSAHMCYLQLAAEDESFPGVDIVLLLLKRGMMSDEKQGERGGRTRIPGLLAQLAAQGKPHGRSVYIFSHGSFGPARRWMRGGGPSRGEATYKDC